MRPLITIIMATRNGADYLPTQLDSILGQSFPDWQLIVSDDGSTDATRQIVARYADQLGDGRIRLTDGPCQGATANFLQLLEKVEGDSWFAYCDQDDLWQPDKLARAVAHLSQRTGPAVYAARTTICDHDLHPLAPAPHFPGPFGLRNALIQACLPGNTTVANAAALRLLQRGIVAATQAKIVSHDWWTYQLLAGAGADIFRDKAQVVLYRQHSANVMGRNDTTRARAARFGMLFDGQFAGWLAQNQAALEPVSHLFTAENQRLLRQFGCFLDASGPRAAMLMLRMGLYRQTRSGTLAVNAAALAGRLRRSN
ncbi:glycosyltransferase family 2 protein [Paracoccus shanxieyensis]|uniref:Glycosyltransferase n=1 Tax=Paracoccus shanxieyensis TaxID=2675752 RepID=A0A6L6IUG7_9RHOB|nr:glycosyltransferase family 2 protein [Paracoccus shanxieyensis]MTH63268.1 glycosyltransferase [Paracoccus shanxieyensis]MTH87182.1 glycosyltransferase [Paracoccus shanxieyensis]